MANNRYYEDEDDFGNDFTVTTDDNGFGIFASYTMWNYRSDTIHFTLLRADITLTDLYVGIAAGTSFGINF